MNMTGRGTSSITECTTLKSLTKSELFFFLQCNLHGPFITQVPLSRSRPITNFLVGVLCRFRKELIAFMCDLEAMFHQFKVKEKDRNHLRFYWWENGDTTKTPERLFIYTELQPLLDARTLGSRKLLPTMSASLAPTQLTLSGKISMLTMASVATVSESSLLIENTKSICARGVMQLHKFISNFKEVPRTGPEDRAKGVKDLDLHSDALPIDAHWRSVVRGVRHL